MAKDPGTMKGKDLTERVYNAFKIDLMLGKIPGNELFSEQTVADLYKCSRTPAREAAGRLASEGFLDKFPSKGYIVKLPSRQEMKEMHVCRWMLESNALKLSVYSAYTYEDLKSMYSLMDALDRQEENGVLKEMAFHTELASFSGNSTLVEMIRKLNEHMARGEYRLPENNYVSLVEQKSEYRGLVYHPEVHREIIDAILSGDQESARRALWRDIYPESMPYNE